jgi:hypothetical protein
MNDIVSIRKIRPLSPAATGGRVGRLPGEAFSGEGDFFLAGNLPSLTVLRVAEIERHSPQSRMM